MTRVDGAVMADQISEHAPAAAVTGPVTPWRVLKDQKKTVFVGVAMMVFGLWFGQYGEWTLAFCIVGGVLLGLVNHLVTEWWLLRTISSGHEITRARLAAATITRLAVLSVIAVGTAAAFWPDGVALLLGLALFRLVALVMTALPLLKELKNA